MRKLLPALMLVANVLLWPAAHAAPTADKPPVVQPAPGKTLVVFSTGAASASRRTVAEVAVLHAGDNALVTRVPIDEPRLPSHFSTGWGYLHAIQLVPGDYLLTLFSEEPYYDYAPASQQIRFKVVAGKPMYLGEAFFSVDNTTGTLTMRDQSFRDLTLFIQKNPQFKASDFRKKLAAAPRAGTKP